MKHGDKLYRVGWWTRLGEPMPAEGGQLETIVFLSWENEKERVANVRDANTNRRFCTFLGPYFATEHEAWDAYHTEVVTGMRQAQDAERKAEEHRRLMVNEYQRVQRICNTLDKAARKAATTSIPPLCDIEKTLNSSQRG